MSNLTAILILILVFSKSIFSNPIISKNKAVIEAHSISNKTKFLNDEHTKNINIEIETNKNKNLTSQNANQSRDEISSFWEKVYDEEVEKHEKHQRHDQMLFNKNYNLQSNNMRTQIDKDGEHSKSHKNKFLNVKSENWNENEMHARIQNKEDARKTIRPPQNIAKLGVSQKQINFKPFGLFKKNTKIQIDDSNQMENNDERTHTNRAVVKQRPRQRHNHFNNPNKHSDVDGHQMGVGKTHNAEISGQDLESQKQTEVRDSEDRKRLPRNAAWFVQAALRMCETGQDPRCKKISVRKGNVKISIKIAED